MKIRANPRALQSLIKEFMERNLKNIASSSKNKCLTKTEKKCVTARVQVRNTSPAEKAGNRVTFGKSASAGKVEQAGHEQFQHCSLLAQKVKPLLDQEVRVVQSCL